MVAVAEEVGLSFGGHVPADVGIEHALDSGMSTVDHLAGFIEGAASDALTARVEAGESIGLSDLMAELDEDKLRALARRAAASGTYVVPTAYLWENLYGSPDVDERLSQPEMRYVSHGQREAWRAQAGRGPTLAPAVREAFFDARRRMLRYLAEAGAPLLMGTDSPQLFNVPGFALHREIQVMSEAGLSNFQILESGTRNVGRYVAEELGLDGSFGTVAAGQRADLVLLEGNPLDDLGQLSRRAGVMVRGTWVTREEIDEGLARLAAKHASEDEG